MKINRFQYSGPTSFDRWVSAVARRCWIDTWREQSRTELLSQEPVWLDEAGLDESPPAVSLALETALAQLSEVEREIIRLRQSEGLSFGEIGRQLGPDWQEGTVRVRHHRALKRLEALLEDHPAIQAWRGYTRNPS